MNHKTCCAPLNYCEKYGAPNLTASIDINQLITRLGDVTLSTDTAIGTPTVIGLLTLQL